MSESKSPTWRCPVCKREFARKSQAHSCKVTPLEEHLSKATPETMEIYAALEAALRTCGPYTAAPAKTQINLLSRTSFGGITLRREWIRLGFVLTRDLDDPRIVSTERLSPRTYVHQVQLRSAADVDKKLRRWLEEAYQVGMLAGRR